jgi:phosphatidylinositol glycan class A protein
MISDFFYPNMGGVENHIFHLGRCLSTRGHTIIIVTHSYPPKQPAGIVHMKYDDIHTLKVYYLPIPVMYNQCTLPTVFASFKFFYTIFKRERIDLVHGHQVLYYIR